jgi:hypothetical protein
MIRKFATVPGYGIVLTWILTTILAGAATAQTQSTPPQQDQDQTQQPAAQQPAENQQPVAQEPAEVPPPVRKPKTPLYNKWSFNVGGGANLASGTTKEFVRNGGGVIAAGAARNYGPYFGLRADVQWDDLPLRASALHSAQAPGATSHVWVVNLGPVINLPVSRVWSGYIVAGAAYFHRTGKLDSSSVLPGAGCNTFYRWWGSCYAGSIPLNGDFLQANVNEFGEEFGAGVARKVRGKIEIYGEYRFLHGSRNSNTTDLRPITVGVRW